MTIPIFGVVQGHTLNRKEQDALRRGIVATVRRNNKTTNQLLARFAISRRTVLRYCRELEAEGQIYSLWVRNPKAGMEYVWCIGEHPEPSHVPSYEDNQRPASKILPQHIRRDDLVAALFGPAQVSA